MYNIVSGQLSLCYN